MSDQQPPAGSHPPPPPPPPSGPPSLPPPGPPSYPPPGGQWGAPQGFEPDGGRGKGLWIALAVIGALLLVGIAITLVLLLTGDDDSDADDRATNDQTSATVDSAPPTESDSPTGGVITDAPSESGPPSGTSTADAVPNEPAAVVEALFSSIFSGDCATAQDLVTEAYLADEGTCDATELPTELFEDVTWKVGEATVDDAAGTAAVEVELTALGESQTTTVGLVMEGGRWRINAAE